MVNVVDASNLERHLYLTIQILEAGAPLILLLNMGDIATRRGMKIDIEKLSEKLNGIPVVAAVASKAIGLDMLKDTILTFCQDKEGQPVYDVQS